MAEQLIKDLGLQVQSIEDFEQNVLAQAEEEMERRTRERENQALLAVREKVTAAEAEVAALQKAVEANPGDADASAKLKQKDRRRRELWDDYRMQMALIDRRRKQPRQQHRVLERAIEEAAQLKSVQEKRKTPQQEAMERERRREADTKAAAAVAAEEFRKKGGRFGAAAAAAASSSGQPVQESRWGNRNTAAPTDFLRQRVRAVVSAAPARPAAAQRATTARAEPVERRRRRGASEDAAMDDSYEDHYAQRIRRLDEEARARRRASSAAAGGEAKAEETHIEVESDDDVVEEEVVEEEVAFAGGYRVPCSVWDKLFDYQQTCVRWLWEIHQQEVGAVVADEMGLGKTIEATCFLEGLRHSGLLHGPILIICPATILRQWVREINEWAPRFRAVVFHSTGAGCATAEGKSAVLDAAREPGVYHNGYVVISSYSTLRIYHQAFLEIPWYYVVLDEGHAIKNPDSEIAIACKQLTTPHRIALTGSPMQNNLTELWSLFDFVHPGKLGTLPIFQAQFEYPINQGGYSNATEFQSKTAYKCACVLRDLVSPYLLRRMKKDVMQQLPGKREQVLFCKLTDDQVIDYSNYLQSEDVQSLLHAHASRGRGERPAMAAFHSLSILRKICNHPDIIQYAESAEDLVATRHDLVDKIDHAGRLLTSGKMKVVQQLLQLWKQQGHKVLIFSQTRIMLDLLQRLVDKEEYRSVRMDGNTPIKNRLGIVDRFNADPSVFVALLTSKVGGIGLNLIGANRVIIYDPDWNPTTDLQARERAWRIGQKRDVSIYRLMCSGTIEEKIYHRQIYKQFLTEKILENPDQHQFFKNRDMKELFTLGSQYNEVLQRLYETELGRLPEAVKNKLEAAFRKGEMRNETHDIFTRQGMDVLIRPTDSPPARDASPRAESPSPASASANVKAESGEPFYKVTKIEAITSNDARKAKPEPDQPNTPIVIKPEGSANAVRPDVLPMPPPPARQSASGRRAASGSASPLPIGVRARSASSAVSVLDDDKELQKLDFCAGVEEYVPPPEDTTAQPPNKPTSRKRKRSDSAVDEDEEVSDVSSSEAPVHNEQEHENFVLKSLFDNESLHVMMDHDKIMKANSTMTTPEQKAEFESSRIAKETEENFRRLVRSISRPKTIALQGSSEGHQQRGGRSSQPKPMPVLIPVSEVAGVSSRGVSRGASSQQQSQTQTPATPTQQPPKGVNALKAALRRATSRQTPPVKSEASEESTVIPTAGVSARVQHTESSAGAGVAKSFAPMAGGARQGDVLLYTQPTQNEEWSDAADMDVDEGAGWGEKGGSGGAAASSQQQPQVPRFGAVRNVELNAMREGGPGAAAGPGSFGLPSRIGNMSGSVHSSQALLDIARKRSTMMST